ncbi:hypothetical protein [Mesorhizobium sp. 8]|uniref:hypothetical protein n=1 Tax=Mesorhizobium sp. 8 TaxID=2584466 RepID=UPI0011247D8E|nr:hypothetical protein [Mesorhizobium sp. 8]QDB99520.1 hypothetical protein FGU64_03380 [Mesorhizobium sp. 8]
MSNFPQINGGSPASTPSNTLPDLTPEETRLLGMSRADREEHFRRMEARAEETAARIKEYELQKQVAEDVEHSLSKNVQYQRMLRGAHPRVASSDTDNENTRQALAQPFAIGAPQALIDTIPIMVGGIQLGPQQAKDMLATGQISKRDYDAGLARELAAYGYAAPGFRTA